MQRWSAAAAANEGRPRQHIRTLASYYCWVPCSLKDFVGDFVGEGLFVRLVGIDGGIIHGINPFAGLTAPTRPTPGPRGADTPGDAACCSGSALSCLVDSDFGTSPFSGQRPIGDQ